MDNSVLKGAKGGGKGGGGESRAPVESPNTLRSRARARIVELLGEGPIVGLVLDDGTPVDEQNGGQAIFLNRTPIQNSDNSYNWQGVTWQQRYGLPDQDHLQGINAAGTPVAVEQEVKFATGRVVRSIVETNVDSVMVVVRIPSLFTQNKETGDTTGASVSYAIDVRSSGGDWQEVHVSNIVNQKCVSPYQRAHRIALPAGGAPWDIGVRRISADSADLSLQNATIWESYTLLTEGKFIYPHCALLALEIDAEQIGTSVPERAARVRGLIIDVPSNYDAETRTYEGVWDGTFKKSWTDNPAWIFRDILVNNRYGLGEFIDPATIDKWYLYQIAQYCDELVPSGFKNEEGEDILEPRFRFNGVINTRKEAWKVIQDITTCFRGMAYWSLGQIFASADMPADPVMPISQANVIDGRFRYSNTAMKARHSVALVSWNDPQDFYRPAIEVVQDFHQLNRFGWRQTEVQAFGCTSRGQAHRFGKWILDSERFETELVEFDMSWDGFMTENVQTLKPGDIVLITDPRKAGGVRAGGRFKDVISDKKLVLDAPFDALENETYNITVVLPSGKTEKVDITSFEEDNTVVNLAEKLSELPLKGARWAIQGVNLAGKQFRIMSIKEEDNGSIFRISGLLHDPTKYARVENNVILPPLNYVRPRNFIPPVTNVNAVESRYFQNGVAHSRVTLSWTMPDDFLAATFHVTADSPRGFVAFPATSSPTLDILDPVSGDWKFYITARSRSGLSSTPTEFEFSVEGWEGVEAPIVTDLQLVGGGTTFGGTAPSLTWNATFPEDAVVYDPEYVVRVYDANDNLLRTETVNTPSYTYDYEKNVNDGGPRRALRFDVTVKSLTGEESEPETISVSNPAPAKITPAVNTTTGFVEISYTPPADADFAGALIFISTVNGFSPDIGNPTYKGPDTKITLSLGAGTYYARVAVYDAFGTDSLNMSDQVSFTVTSVDQAIASVLPAIINAQGNVTLLDLENLADSVANLIVQMMQERDENWGLHQRTRQMLAAEAGAIRAAIAEEQYARVQGDLAEARARRILQAQISSDVMAVIAQEQIARADFEGSIAQQVTTLSTTIQNNISASITQVMESVNGIKVRFGVIGTINGETGGFLFEGVQSLDGTVTYTTQISGDLIVQNSITTDKLSVNFLSAISADMGEVTAGIVRSPDSTIVIDLNEGRFEVWAEEED